MLKGKHVADVSFSQSPEETIERKVSPLVILCTNIGSLPYLPSHPSLKITATAMPIKHWQCLSSWCRRTRAYHSNQILGITVPVCRSMCSLCWLACQLKLSSLGWKLSLCSKCGTGGGFRPPRWGKETQHTSSADKGGTLPQIECRMQNCSQDESRSRGKQTAHKLSESIR